MADAPKTRQWKVLFSGRVQGVGFRYTTQQVAREHPVSGTVRNLPDGRVEVIAEGARDDLSAFIAAVENAMGRCIRDRDVSEHPATGRFEGFRIAY